MPDTAHGITYPGSGDHTRLWEHFQTLAEDVEALVVRPSGKMRQTTAQSVPNNAATRVTFDEAPVAVGMTAALANERLIVLKAGLYRVNGVVHYNSSTTGGRNAFVYVNGTQAEGTAQQTGSAGVQSAQIDTVLALAVNDYVELWTSHAAGAALSTWVASGFVSRLELTYLGPAV